jgi:hypothetical protein
MSFFYLFIFLLFFSFIKLYYFDIFYSNFPPCTSERREFTLKNEKDKLCVYKNKQRENKKIEENVKLAR